MEISKIKWDNTIYDIVDNSALHTLDNTVTPNGDNAVNGGGIYNAITASSAAVLETVEEVTDQLFGYAEYDSTDTLIKFYNSTAKTEVLGSVDASDFIKDGFLQSVTIENKVISGESVPCLVFIWNTDAGIQETDIPLNGIFDPTNYYTKTEVNGLLANKQDTLVSGTNIKTVGGTSLLGSGNIATLKAEVSGDTLVFTES